MSANITSSSHHGVRLQHGRFTLVDLIGVGTGSTVWTVKCRKGKDRSLAPYAVKVLHPISTFVGYLAEKRQILEEAFHKEAEIHALVQDHVNILTLHASFTEGGYHCFLFDLCQGGTLTDLLHTPFFWKRDDRAKLVLTQLIDALQHCHDRGVAHRDLNPENVLISLDRQHIYLTDFGLASQETACTDFGIGSKSYMSPECYGKDFSNQRYNPQVSDVWSLGIILLEMLVGCEPWSVPSQGEDKYYAQYLQYRGKILHGGLPLPPSAAALLSRILEPIPELRISLAELRQELEQIGALTLTEEELAFASGTTRKAYAWRVQDLGVPYNIPPLYSKPIHPPGHSTVPISQRILSRAPYNVNVITSTPLVIPPFYFSPMTTSSLTLTRPSTKARPSFRRHGSNMPSICEVVTEAEGEAASSHASSRKPSSSISSYYTATWAASSHFSRPSTSTSITAPSSCSDFSSSKPPTPPSRKRASLLVRAMDIVRRVRSVRAEC